MAKSLKPRRKRFITILGVKVKIKYVKSLLCEIEDDPLDGAFDAKTMTIFISESSDIKSTILHEALHACLELSGVRSLLSNKVEESIVCALENSLKNYFTF